MMGFELDVKAFVAAVDSARAVIGMFASEEVHYGLKFDEGASYLLASAGAASAILSLNHCTKHVNGKFTFAFDPDVLLQVLARRTTIEAEYTKNRQLKFMSRTKAGSYSGEIVTQPYPEILDNLRIPKKTGATIPRELLAAILKGIKVTSVTAVHNSDDVNSMILVEKGVCRVAATDTYHMAQFKSNKIKNAPDMKLAVPAGYFNLFARIAALEGYTDTVPFLTITPKNLSFSSPLFSVTMPSIQMEDTLFDRAFQMFNQLGKKVLSFDVEHDKIDAAIQNLGAIYEQGSIITLEDPVSKGDKHSIKFKTGSNYGKLGDTLRVENMNVAGFKSVNLDPKTFQDSLRLLDRVITVSVLDKPKVFMFEQNHDDGNVVHIGLLV